MVKVKFVLSSFAMLLMFFAFGQKGSIGQSQAMVVAGNISYGVLIQQFDERSLGLSVNTDNEAVKLFFENITKHASGKNAKGVNSYAPKTINTDFSFPGKYLDEPIVYGQEDSQEDSEEGFEQKRINVPAMFRFSEQWLYDEQNKKFTKSVLGYSPVVAVFSQENELRGTKPLFWMWTDRLDASSGKDMVLGQNVMYDVTIRTLLVICDEEYIEWYGKYAFLEENCMYNNINIASRQEFILSILRDVYSGALEVKDKNGIKLDTEELKKLLVLEEESEVMMENPETLEEETVSYLSEVPLNINYFSKLRFIEEWSYNPTSFRFTKKVKAIGFIYSPNDDEMEMGVGGIDPQLEPMFWVYFDQK
jgi:hypothetical protein